MSPNTDHENLFNTCQDVQFLVRELNERRLKLKERKSSPNRPDGKYVIGMLGLARTIESVAPNGIPGGARTWCWF